MNIVYTCPECGGTLYCVSTASIPAYIYYQCASCGWSSGVTKEQTIRIPYPTTNTINNSPCDSCRNNIKNGGSGICNCILGTPQVTC